MAEEQEPLLNTDEGIEVLVVAVDASTEAARVLATAARQARAAPQATVHLIHVFRASRMDRARAGAPLPPEDAVHDAKDHFESQVRTLKRQCRNSVVSHFVVGDPNAEIIKLAEESRADLLVIGTHDHTGLERLLLGSIAEALMRKAPCSVLVVRRPHRR